MSLDTDSLDSTATRGIVGRLRDADADDMPGSGGDMLGFGRTSLLNTTDQPSAPAIDWASLGRSEFDLPGTCVGASRSRPDTHLIINLDTLGQSEIAMQGDAADLAMNAIAPNANRKRKKQRCKSNQAAHHHVSEFDLPGTCVGASRSRPDTQPIINLDTLGKSELAMPGVTMPTWQ